MCQLVNIVTTINVAHRQSKFLSLPHPPLQIVPKRAKDTATPPNHITDPTKPPTFTPQALQVASLAASIPQIPFHPPAWRLSPIYFSTPPTPEIAKDIAATTNPISTTPLTTPHLLFKSIT